MKLEEALAQLNYWKDACERARVEHSKRIDAMNQQIAELTRQLNDANERATTWEKNYRYVMDGRA